MVITTATAAAALRMFFFIISNPPSFLPYIVTADIPLRELPSLNAELPFAKRTPRLRNGVVQASEETGIAITDYNEAMYRTLKATGDTANAIDYTTIAVKAAKGGFTDISSTVDALTTVMNTYGLTAVL